MTLQWLLNWWNLVFLLPFLLALLYLGLYTASGITFGEADLDADADMDHDVDVDHDIDADQNFEADHDVDGDHDADTDQDADHDADSNGDRDASVPAHLAAIHWLGIGRVPLSLLLMLMLIAWGVVGFLTNAALASRGALAALVSVPLAAAVSVLIAHLFVTVVDRYMPLCSTTARRRHALLGSVGEAIFPIDQRFGMVSVRDEMGDLYQVPCRVETSSEPVPKGSAVQLISYNARSGFFYVRRQAIAQTTPMSK